MADPTHNPWGDEPDDKAPSRPDVPSWASTAEPKRAAAPVTARSPPPKPAPITASPISSEDERRAEEFQQREKVQANKLAPLKDPSLARTKNFPPFPACCRVGIFKPCFVLDISGEIPHHGQSLTKMGFTQWSLYAVTLFWNFITVFVGTFAPNLYWYSGEASMLLSCTFYLLTFIFLGYCCGFDYLYNAIRLDSSMKFGWFMFVCICEVVVCVMASIGPPGWGFSGIWFSSLVLEVSNARGIVCFSCAVLWIVNGLFAFVLLGRTLKFYRSSGMSIEKAQAEGIKGVASNSAVQGAVKDAATQGVRSAFSTA